MLLKLWSARALSLALLTSTALAHEPVQTAPVATPAELELPFRELAVLEHGFISTAPDDRDDGQDVGSLAELGVDEDAVTAFVQEVASAQYGNYDSLLIAHDGRLVLESYFRRGRINAPHPQASAVKGYTTLVLGRAMQLGYLTMADLDRPVSEFLEDLDPDGFVEGVEMITLHQAMTMRSGLRISEEQAEALSNDPERMAGQGQVQAWFETSAPVTAESQAFLYQGTDPDLVMQVIDAVVPGSAEDFIRDELLGKLGITDYQWETVISGLPAAGSRASLTSRDMVKLGNLVSNQGQWQGEQLIPADFLIKATSGMVKPDFDWIADHYMYGFFWYHADLAVGDKVYTGKLAWGGGGQRVVTIDELDLVLVITGHERDDIIMEQITSKLLPEFVQ